MEKTHDILCPFCRTPIDSKATVCKHCMSNIGDNGVITWIRTNFIALSALAISLASSSIIFYDRFTIDEKINVRISELEIQCPQRIESECELSASIVFMNPGETSIVAELVAIRLSKTYVNKVNDLGKSTEFDAGYRETMTTLTLNKVDLGGVSFFYKLDTSPDPLIITAEGVKSLDIQGKKIQFSERSKHKSIETGQIVDLKTFMGESPTDILLSLVFSFVSSKSGEETRIEYKSWFHPDIVRKSLETRGHDIVYTKRSATIPSNFYWEL